MSPSRPRQHEVETESKQIFGNLMPSAWVVREQASDYGIDQEVEVFEDRRATSLLFKVQLKGTDAAHPEHPSISISTETFKYWRDLDLPVLLVLVDVQRDVVYARWAFAIDELRGVETPGETFTVHFDQTHVLSAESYTLLAEDVVKFRSLRRREIARPLPITLRVAGWVEPDPKSIASHLVTEGSLAGVASLGEAGDLSGYVVDLTPGLVTVRLPVNYASVSFAALPTDSPGDVAAKTVLALGLGLGTAGIDTVAIPVLERALRNAPHLAVDDVLMASLGIYMEHASPSQCLDLGLFLIDLDGPVAWICAQALTVCALRERPLEVHGVIEHLNASFRSCADRLASKGDTDTAGRTMFNLAAGLRHLREWEAAVVAFSDAVALRPEHMSEPRFHRMLGGVLWELGRFVEAAETYEAGVVCSSQGDEDLVPLQVDALLASGQYARARDALGGWTPGASHGELGVILREITRFVTDVVGVQEQERHVLDDSQLHVVLDEVTSEDGALKAGEAWPHLREAFSAYDVLQPILLIVACQMLDARDRAAALLTVAHVEHGDPDIWVAAVEALHEAGQAGLRDAAIGSAVLRCRADFVSACEERDVPLDSALLDRVHLLSQRLEHPPPDVTDDGFLEIDAPLPTLLDG